MFSNVKSFHYIRIEIQNRKLLMLMFLLGIWNLENYWSLLLLISAISLWRDSSNIVWSASIILSMLLVEIIYFFPSASFSRSHGGCQLFLLGRWDLENYWSLLLLPSAGQVAGWWTRVLLVLLLLLRYSVSGEYRMVGYLRRHFDAQVSKAGDQYSGRWAVINDVPFSLKCVLFILF